MKMPFFPAKRRVRTSLVTLEQEQHHANDQTQMLADL